MRRWVESLVYFHGNPVTLGLLAPAMLGCSLFLVSAHAQQASPDLRHLPAAARAPQNLSPAEQKLDAALLAIVQRKKAGAVETTPSANLRLPSADRIAVLIRGSVSAELLAAIQSRGGAVVAQSPRDGLVDAVLPVDAVTAIAGLPGITKISITPKANVNQTTLPDPEGYAAHAVAAVAGAPWNATGKGVKVCVISNNLATKSATNNTDALTKAAASLPNVDILSVGGKSQSGDVSNSDSDGEGVAMLEIVHRLAPDADLMFATGRPYTAMVLNIQGLVIAGCHIIVDDISYSLEPWFAEGTIAKIIRLADNYGVLYITNASNSGNLDSKTSSVWEGDFVASSTVTAEGVFHAFDPADATSTVNRIYEFKGGSTNVDLKCKSAFLQWNDPVSSVSSNEYRLVVTAGNTQGQEALGFNAARTPGVAYAPADSIDVTQLTDVTKALGQTPRLGGLSILKAPGAEPRHLRIALDENCGRLAYSTDGVIHGNSAAPHALTVGAVSAAGRTTAFQSDALPAIEDYSGDGPRRIYFDTAGQPITPGDNSAGGGRLIKKPDLVAASRVTTDVTNFAPFKGTSAAAPHAAAIAALVKSKFPHLSTPQLRYVLTQSALRAEVEPWPAPLERCRVQGSNMNCTPVPPQPAAEPWNRNMGFGVVMADRAMEEAARVARGHALQVNDTAAIELDTAGRLIDRRIPGSRAAKDGCMPAFSQTVLSFGLGARHGIAVLQDGTLWTWSTEAADSSPTCQTTKLDGTGFVSVVASEYIAVAIAADGSSKTVNFLSASAMPWDAPSFPNFRARLVAVSVLNDNRAAALLSNGTVSVQNGQGAWQEVAGIEHAVAITQAYRGTDRVTLRTVASLGVLLADGTFVEVDPTGPPVAPLPDIAELSGSDFLKRARNGSLAAVGHPFGDLVDIRAITSGHGSSWGIDLNGILYRLSAIRDSDYQQSFGPLIRGSGTDCTNGDVDDDDRSKIAGQISIIRFKDQNSGKTRVTVSLTRGLANTTYTFSQKCGSVFGTVVAGADGLGTATFDWPGTAPPAGDALAFQLSSSAGKFQTRMKAP